MIPLPCTLGELKSSPWGDPARGTRSVRDEVRTNLLPALQRGAELFPGIHGYDHTIIPQLVNALLARRELMLLGLRRRARSRLLRALTACLDERLRSVAGS